MKTINIIHTIGNLTLKLEMNVEKYLCFKVGHTRTIEMPHPDDFSKIIKGSFKDLIETKEWPTTAIMAKIHQSKINYADHTVHMKYGNIILESRNDVRLWYIKLINQLDYQYRNIYEDVNALRWKELDKFYLENICQDQPFTLNPYDSEIYHRFAIDKINIKHWDESFLDDLILNGHDNPTNYYLY